MAETSGFFNSVGGDRKYDADFFSQYFADFISNGVYPNPSTMCQIIANNNMTVTEKAGNAYINGMKYKNDGDNILTIDIADGVLKRIDRIVLRYTVLNREIKAYVKKGAFASTPVAPTLQRDADAYELGLADIYIAAGATSISQANITDLRLNNTYCGIVHGVIDQVDTTTLFNQYQAWYQETTGQAQVDIADLQEKFANDFNAWFTSVRDTLSTDAAGNLLNLINTHTTDISSLNAQLASLKTNDAAVRREVLGIKLKLDEMNVVEFLNKTGIGFFDLFEDTSNINTGSTTATVSTTDVVFTGTQLLQMLSQNYDNFTTLELAIYDLLRETFTVTPAISNSPTISMNIKPGSRTIGEKFYYGGEVYTITNVAAS